MDGALVGTLVTGLRVGSTEGDFAATVGVLEGFNVDDDGDAVDDDGEIVGDIVGNLVDGRNEGDDDGDRVDGRSVAAVGEILGD